MEPVKNNNSYTIGAKSVPTAQQLRKLREPEEIPGYIIEQMIIAAKHAYQTTIPNTWLNIDQLATLRKNGYQVTTIPLSQSIKISWEDKTVEIPEERKVYACNS